jgi:predicted DNA-binding antitoxin AbrB/MazE fold protein
MVKTVDAVYENGMLRPLEPLQLQENQHVTLTVSEPSVDPADAWLDHEYMASIDAVSEPEPTIEEVRSILARVPGKFSDDIRAQRDARG